MTLPLVPVFMWLIGRYTERRTQERWQALSLLANHFADVVRGLPTLRAFNRSRAQAEQIAAVSDRYRRATMGTLRVAFLSGAVLELAATLGIALVAVTVGVRLVDGGIGFEAGLDRARARARALRAAAQPGGAVPRQRRRRGRRRTDARPDRRAADRSHGREAAPDLRTTSIRLEDVGFRYPGRPVPRAARGSTSSSSRVRRSRWSGRAEPERAPSPRCCCDCREPTARAGHRRTASTSPRATRQEWRRQLAWVPQRPTLLRGDGRREHPARRRRGAADERVARSGRLAGADGFVARAARGLRDPGRRRRPAAVGGRAAADRARARVPARRAARRPRRADRRTSIRRAPRLVADGGRAARGADRTVLLIAHRPELAAQRRPRRAARRAARSCESRGRRA